jgi:transposase
MIFADLRHGCILPSQEEHFMIILGLDPHPGSHTVVALDSNGRLLANLTVPNTEAGLEQLHLFAKQFGARRWAIEGAGNHFIAKFVTELLAQEETVYSIAPSLTSQYRSRRGRKKNDVVDAANVARALLANPQFPALRSREQQRELQEMSRAQHRLSEQLKSNRSALAELTEHSPVREIIEQVIQALVVQLKELEKQLRAVVSARMPSLLDLPGVGPVIAGTVLAEVGEVQRFPSANHFATYCGAAPVERGSGQNTRMQINPGGNRRLNWALHIVALVRLRMDDGRSKQFLETRVNRGKSKRAALRLLKTYIAWEIFKVMCQSDLLSQPSFA